MQPVSDARIGTLVGGKYRVERALGHGGMGNVFVALQEPLGRRVALKVIRGSDIEQEQRERFLREATVVAQLKCPHIVTLYDFGEQDGEPFIAMELLEGETLRDRMNRGPVALEEALSWVRDIACALRSAHEAGIVHRDLKPENVVLVPDRDRGSIAKLLDFGIAKLRTRSEMGAVTQLGMIIGTPGYIAPEQILHGRGDDPRVDLYALGVVLFELLAGMPPYAGATPFALLMAHANDPIPDLRSRSTVPVELSELASRLLAKDPNDRPSDGGTLVCALDQTRARIGISAVVSAPLAPTELVPLPIPERPSIAVQPFVGLGGEDEEMFAEGISEDILTALSCFKQLFVVALTSMMQRSGRDTDALRVSRSMGVRYVLQGSVRRSGDRVRINAKLIDGVSGAQVWAQRYDRELRDLFAVQDEVTQAIVACVAGRVEEAHAEIARKKAPHTLAAYDWLARGRALHHRRTLEDNVQAREAMDKAVEIDPDYAQAHAWRGCVYGQACFLGGDFKECIAHFKSSVARALELDDNDSECQRLAAEMSMAFDLDKAWYHHQRAIALNPNDARIVGQRGELCFYRGELDDAAAALELAARLDPLSPKPFLRHLACVYYVQRNLVGAAEVLKRLDERPDAIALAAAIAALRGDEAEMQRAVQRLREIPNAQAQLPIARKPFTTEATRNLWLEGFQRAGLV